jgi:alpha-tubulin suppressor-like RCC1 family protein
LFTLLIAGCGARTELLESSRSSAPVADIAVGSRASCIRRNDNTVTCWGAFDSQNWDHFPEFTGQYAPTPALMITVPRQVDAISLGNDGCGLTFDGRVSCWGWGPHPGCPYGQLCDPSTVSLPQRAEQIALGSNYGGCALLAGGRVVCWGDSYLLGQNGNIVGYPTETPTPTNILLEQAATRVAVGDYVGCAVLADKTIRCWGLSIAGDITPDLFISDAAQPLESVLVSTPTQFPNVSDVVQVAAGDAIRCVLTASKEVYCWGTNKDGCLTEGRRLPDEVLITPLLTATKCRSIRRPIRQTIPPVRNITLRGTTICAITTADVLYCWCGNAFGGAGNGDPVNTFQRCDDDGSSVVTPTPVPGVGAIREVDTDIFHTCALTMGGRVMCWGRNANGELGDGTKVNRARPVDVTVLAH